jgi:predicted RNA binding protein YcfA (HicA-like mRNA interferase family)
MPPKVSEVIRRLTQEGWHLVEHEGSHRQYRHPQKPGKVTVAGKPSKTLTEATWQSIQRQAGWKERRS